MQRGCELAGSRTFEFQSKVPCKSSMTQGAIWVPWKELDRGEREEREEEDRRGAGVSLFHGESSRAARREASVA